MLDKILARAEYMLTRGERFGIPVDYFESHAEVQHMVVKLTTLIGGPVRANAHMGILTIYPDVESEGTDFAMGMRRE